MRVLVTDTETTGTATHDNVIELAVYDTTIEDFAIFHKYGNTETLARILQGDIEVSRYKPKVPCNPFAYEVHGIGMVELQDKPCTSTVKITKDIDYIVGHNIAFDIRLLQQSNPELEWLDEVPSICTMELARGIKKNLKIPLPSAKLAQLVEYYYPEHTELLVPHAHAAKSDVVNTVLVALAMLQHVPGIETWKDLYNFQQSLKAVKGKK